MPSEQTMERYLSIADLSRLLDLPESTTRYYCKRFAAHLPSVGEGRKRRFVPESEAVLRVVVEEMRRSKNAFAVDLALAGAASGARGGGEFPVDDISMAPATTRQSIQISSGSDDVSVFSSQIMSLMERQTQALQEIAGAMTLFASYHPANGNKENEALREELAALRETMRLSEEKQTKDLEQTRKWLARFSEALVKR